MSARDAAEAIARGLKRHAFPHKIVTFPMADGGEGTMDVLAARLGLQSVEIEVANPLFRPRRARYLLGGAHAVIELAEAAGLQLLAPAERDPLNTTTLGVGKMLADALARGARDIFLAIGGSATNDCGVGLASALGWRFVDDAGEPIRPVGGALHRIARIEPPTTPLPNFVLRVARDVQIPLLGPTGAAHMFARQKGADAAAIAALEAGAAHLCEIVHQQIDLGRPENFGGVGAAGGAGFGAMVFLGGGLYDGAEAVMDAMDFQAEADRADLIITGEGRLDGQTGYGKVVAAVTLRARWRGKRTPVVALCGAVDATAEEIAQLGLKDAIAISDPAAPLTENLARTAENLERAAAALKL